MAGYSPLYRGCPLRSRSPDPRADEDWAARWAPYDDATYRDALSCLGAEDIVLDIGAGDLRFARMAARISRLVVGVENNFQVLKAGLKGEPLPQNLLPVLADARAWPTHAGYTAGVLLMRHCHREDFVLYAQKLRESGCLRLITNARWGLGVEEVPLTGAVPYDSLEMGWYGCVICGQTGFKEGDPALLTPGMDAVINVEGCPSCREDRGKYA